MTIGHILAQDVSMMSFLGKKVTIRKFLAAKKMDEWVACNKQALQ
jgi:hypothetical protein